MYKKIILEKRSQLEKAIEHLATEMSGLRTGRANAALVENILVESYGAKTPLKNLASITVPEPRSLAIQPWDRGLLSAVEKAISASSLGIQPVNDGANIRVNLPALTEERRGELVKTVKQHAEDTRIRVRNIREEIWREVGKLLKEKMITEDQKFEAQDKLKELVEEYNEKIKSIVEKKEQEIMTV